MKPSQVAQSLRHIASKIQNSKQPDRRLVARDLKRVLAAMKGSVILIDSYANVAIRTTDVIATLKEQIRPLLKGGHGLLINGEPINTVEEANEILAEITSQPRWGNDIGDAIDGIIITRDEGSEGVAVGFSSADRASSPYPWPEILQEEEDEFIGNDDPMIYKTTGVAVGIKVPGKSSIKDPRYIAYCKTH